MTRAQETAAFIKEALEDVALECDPQLEEGHPGHMHTQTRFDQVFRKYFVPPDGTRETNVLVTHANLIRFLLCRWVTIIH